MNITLFQETGLKRVVKWLKENGIGRLSVMDLKDALKTCNISFCLEGLTRFQSTLICELDDSYVQQSQRYVVMDNDGYTLPEGLSVADTIKARKLMEQSFSLYAKMSELKEESIGKKGRLKEEDYKYGIPIEDARYILPLTVNTNVTCSMSGDKLIDFVQLIQDPKYGSTFDDLSYKLSQLIPIGVMDKIYVSYESGPLVKSLYQPMLDKITPEDNMILIDRYESPDLSVGLGAVTSTNGKTPSDILISWGDDALVKAQGTVERVMGYGHTGIMEQARTTFGMMCSLSTYHQQLRHRLPKTHREDFSEIINGSTNGNVVVPDTIARSHFYEEFAQLVLEFTKFRNAVYESNDYELGLAAPFLLNCDCVKLIISTNARIDETMLKERTCMTAQWEIRALSVKKLQILRQTSPILYEKSLPPCVNGKCKEGKMTCGKSDVVKEFFKKL